MTGYTVRRCEQLETFPETIEPELRPAVCERRQTDRLKENYSIDDIANDNDNDNDDVNDTFNQSNDDDDKTLTDRLKRVYAGLSWPETCLHAQG